MGMLYGVIYYWPNGSTLAGCDNNVSGDYVRQSVPKLCERDHCYAIARNVNADHHMLCYGPAGEIAYDNLPWVVQARRKQEEREYEVNRQLIARGYAMLRERGVSVLAVRDGAALVHRSGQLPDKWYPVTEIESAARQENTGDGLVAFYRALRHVIRNYQPQT